MKWLTTSEVAVQLRETRQTVSRRCKRGEIEATLVGREWRISETALDAFLAPVNVTPIDKPAFRSAREKRTHLRRPVAS